jgi:hypothetical protein
MIRVKTHLRRKTHLQWERLMTPPRIGPRSKEIVKTADTIIVYDAYFSCGTNSNMIAIQTAYMPDPPSPWKALSIILFCNLVMHQVFLKHTYNWVMVLAAPQAPENTTKIRTAVMTEAFRPNMSLSLAQIIKNPNICLAFSNSSSTSWLTDICQKICCHNPTTLGEALKRIRNPHERCANNRDFQVGQEQTQAKPTVVSIVAIPLPVIRYLRRCDAMQLESRQVDLARDLIAV